MLVFEGKVFKLCLDFEEAEPVGERSVDVKGLSGYLILLFGAHGAERPHVVEPVGHFDKHHPDVRRHG